MVWHALPIDISGLGAAQRTPVTHNHRTQVQQWSVMVEQKASCCAEQGGGQTSTNLSNLQTCHACAL